jgi:uncharacterized membrane protein YdbT with pleckstrin-like domain
MSYVDHVIQPGETVIQRAALHWVVYVSGAVLIGIGVVLSAFAYGMSVPAADGTATTLRLAMIGVGLVGVILGLLALIKAFVRRWTTEIAITSKRVIYKTGLIRRLTSEISADKIETVLVDQSVLGRVLNYGTVVIRGTGGGLEPIHTIARPLEFRSKLTAR